MAVTVTRPPKKRPEPKPVKRRASPPREPRVRKSGFRPILRMAALRVRRFRSETFTGQVCAVSAFIVVMCACIYVGVWMAREANHKGSVALAAYAWCDQPNPVDASKNCKQFGCLSRIIERNEQFVRICHPEALRS